MHVPMQIISNCGPFSAIFGPLWTSEFVSETGPVQVRISTNPSILRLSSPLVTERKTIAARKRDPAILLRTPILIHYGCKFRSRCRTEVTLPPALNQAGGT